jgi:hypothetical protein
MKLETLLEILEGDRELLDELFRAGVIEMHGEFAPTEADDARVARVLVRELDVNWPGVEIILRMRRELVEMQRQTEELLRLIASRLSTSRTS